MSAVRLPSEHHVGLHCSPKSFLERGPGGEVAGISIAAFRPDPDGISVNWLEYEGDTPDHQFQLLCEALRRSRTVKKTHLVGLMRIADIEETGSEDKPLHVEHAPITGNDGHSLVKGINPKDEELLQELTLIVELREFAPQMPPAQPDAQPAT